MMEEIDFLKCKATFDKKDWRKLEGTDVRKNFQYGKYFPIAVKGRAFSLELKFIEWGDGLVELHPNVVSGSEKMLSLHGRLRLSVKTISSGRLRGTRSCSLRQARFKPGVTAHSNLFNASFEDLDKHSGIDTYSTLYDLGAIDLGTKEDVFSDMSTKRNELCVVFDPKNVDVPIAAFIISRVLPLCNKR